MKMNYELEETDCIILQDLLYKDSHNTCARQDGKADILSKDKLDLFLPKDCNCETPVVVFIHGGGWMRGDRRAYRHYFSCYDTNLLVALALAYYDAYWNVGKAFARAGVACAVVSYRLSRLEFPWLIIELCFSLFMSLSVFLTPLFCFAVLAYCSSRIFGFNVTTLDLARTSYMPLFTVTVILVLSSFFILWFIICNAGEGYFITPLEKFLPLLMSLLVTSISMLIIDINVTSVATCFTLCLGLCLLHSFGTFQQTWRPVVTHPSHITDVACSVKWIKDYGSTTQKFNPNQIFLCGHSAGGHLVSLLALDHKYLMKFGLSVTDIKGVMSLSGVYNLHILSGGLLEYLFLRPAFGHNHDNWTAASPYHQLMRHKEITKETNCKPYSSCGCYHGDDISECFCTVNTINQEKTPFLILNAEKDPLLQQDAEEFVKLLKIKEYSCQHHVVKKTNHLSLVLSFGRIQEEWQAVEEHCLKFIKDIGSRIN
ncbi:uncharacterized protein LOC116290946 [Actinia tenebrosa]|uniref:Uncharacterized protein LOC116290946 n=1 Tax=Actinia tenebrosa TaxID=6105 RepID=A0A6P8HMQ7_ACTTE|nr:uncharacterized protein LOC116290946 [Actinia tenebrosa]